MRRIVRSYRDWVVIGIVLCGHVLLVMLFARIREHERNVTIDDQRPMTLISIPARESVRAQAPSAPVITQSTLIDIPPPQLPRSLELAPSESPSRSAPRIDWRSEAERSASRAIQQQSAPGARGFEEREEVEPTPKPRAFGWDPSPPGTVGFSGGLPYVRVGKRCAIGLGFFGCAIGEMPAPNGDLFDGMDDPDRDRSSVPDANERTQPP